MRFAWASLVSTVAVLGTAGQASAQGRICFARAETEGAMNLHVVRIFVGRHRRLRETLELRGGDTSCVSLPPGRWSIQARSARPGDPSASDPGQCRSAVVSARVRRGSVTFSVLPRPQASAAVCGWELR